MAHPKIAVGNTRPLATAVIEQQKFMESLKSPDAPLIPVKLTPEPNPKAADPSPPASLPRNVPELLSEWFRAQPSERVVLESGVSKIVVSSPFVCDNETTVAFAFDPKLISFGGKQNSESMVTLELGYESTATLIYRGASVPVLFAGGIFTFKGLPLGIVSFFKTNPPTT